MLRELPIMSLLAFLGGCVGIPANVTAVKDFNAKKYEGTWYEVARLENSFEKGLEKCTAEYSLRDDGGLRVVNRGYDPKKDRWKQAEGKAYFVGSSTEGRLKVSFFGPFYGAYNIIALDEDYSYSMICGKDYAYLWILSRTPQLPKPVVRQLVEKAQGWEFKTEQLLYVKQ